MRVAAAFLAVWAGITQAAAAVPAKNTKKALIPAADFARYATYDQMELSPDGQHLAASARSADGKTALLILALPGLKPVSGLRFENGGAMGYIYWVSNTRVIVAIAHQEEGDDRPFATGELFGMNVDGSGKNYLFGFRGKTAVGTRIKTGNEEVLGTATMVDPLVHDPDHALVMVNTSKQRISQDSFYFSKAYTPLYLMNVHTGRIKEVARPPIRSPSDYFASARGQVRLVHGMGEDSPDPQTFWKDDRSEWAAVPIKGRGLTPLALSPDGSRAFFTVEEVAGQTCLVEMRIPASPAGIRKWLCKPASEL